MLSKGVRVFIRENLSEQNAYNGVCFVSDMICYLGGYDTVSRVTEDGIIYLEGNSWCWDETMLIVEAPPEASDVSVKLRTDIFGVGALGDIVKAKQHGEFIYLGKEYLPMQGIISADEAEIIKEDN